MKTATIIDVIAAAHWTYKLSAIPREFSQRGGIMLVGPPEQLKTQFISMLTDYPRTLVLSDLTTRELSDFHQELGNGYKTIGFTAFEKVSQRDPTVATNLIGHLTALAEEGFRGSYKIDKRQRSYHAKCLIVGAVPQYFYDLNFKDWMQSGFHRRFLWPNFKLSDPDIIRQSIARWQPLNLREGSLGFPIPTESIAYNVTDAERSRLAGFLQPGEGLASPLILLSKIYAVLKWRYQQMLDPAVVAMAILEDFSESLRHVADLEIGSVKEILDSQLKIQIQETIVYDGPKETENPKSRKRQGNRIHRHRVAKRQR